MEGYISIIKPEVKQNVTLIEKNYPSTHYRSHNKNQGI